MLKFIKNGEIIDRNILWGSIHGHKTQLKDMDDNYSINLWHHLSKLISHNTVPDFVHTYGLIRSVIEELLDERGINISNYPTELPYEVDGEWFYKGLKATETQVLSYKMKLPIPNFENEEEFEETSTE